MGVRRLWSFINKNKKDIVEYVDLVQIAKGHPNKLKILIDFYSFEHYLKDMFWKSTEQITGNPLLIFDGGEYDLMDAFILSFINALRSVNIELVFFLDGAKGSSYNDSKQKFETWCSRHSEDQESLATCFKFLEGNVSSVLLKFMGQKICLI